MNTMRLHPRGYGGGRRSPDQVKQDGWREQGVLAVAVDDERLSWPERELVRQLGEKLYGKRRGGRTMAEWTRDMVEERVIEAAAVLRKLPGPRVVGLLQHLAGHPAQRPRDRGPGPEADAGAAVAAGDQPHGGGDHLEPVPRAR